MIRLWIFFIAGLCCAEPWRRHTIDNTSRGADGVRLADFNRDGHADIVTGWEQGKVVRLYVNPGPKAAKEPWPLVTVGSVCSPEDAFPFDADGDGALDIISACQEGEPSGVFVHWAPKDRARILDASAWKTEHIPASGTKTRWMFSAALEIGKGKVVLVAGGQSARGAREKANAAVAHVGWFEEPPKSRDVSKWIFHPMSEVGWTMSLHAMDMDRDGDADLLITDRYGPLSGTRWLENPAADDAKPWRSHWIGDPGGEAMFMDVADVDKDGAMDIITAQRPDTILIRYGPDWRRMENIPAADFTGTVKGVRAVDLDLDGKVDIVYTCEHAQGKSGVVMRSGGTGKWHDISGSPGEKTGIKFDLIQLIDMDRDGDLDLLTTEEVTGLGVIWYENPAR